MVNRRISREAMLMDMAFLASRRSTCSRAQVGAIISTGGRVISTGYNGAPAGLSHCEHTDNEPCRRSVHAEANAITFAAKYGMSTRDTILTCTHEPCLECSRLIINAGIIGVVFYHEYRIHEGVELLQEAGVPVVSIERERTIKEITEWPQKYSS